MSLVELILCILVLVVLAAGLLSFLWGATPRRRDGLARRFALGQMRVDRILGVSPTEEEAVRALRTFVVDLEDSRDRVGASLVVLAPNQAKVAQAIEKAGEEARKMDALATSHRLVKVGGESWAVVMIPSWLDIIATETSARA